MSRTLQISALGAIVRIDLAGLSDGDADAVREAWRDALVADADPDAEDAVVVRAITPAVEPLPVPEPVEGPIVERATFPVVERAKRDETSLDLPTVLASLSQRVTLAAIQQRRGAFWMLHAAGVAADDGRVVVLVGPSGSGKTTAARVLGARFGYVSDETVAIDDAGRVWPYRKPLSVIEHPGEPKTQCSPSDLGLRSLPDAPLRLAAIVLLYRNDDGPHTAVLTDVEFGAALEDLVPQSSYLTAMPAPLQTIAGIAVAAGGIRRVTYRNAASLVGVLQALFAQPGSAADVISPHAGRVVGKSDPSPAGRAVGEADVSRPLRPRIAPGPLYSRAAIVDALDLPDPARLAILSSADDGTGMLHVLAGIAPAIWRAADAASARDLTDAALAAYGPPPGSDAGSLVEAAAAQLTKDGLLEVAFPKWRVRADVAWTDHHDRVVALALHDSGASPLALEGTAAVIWRAIVAEAPASVERVIAIVAATAGTDEHEIDEGVRSFFLSLQGAGLVELS